MTTDKIRKLEEQLEALRDKPDQGVSGKRKVDLNIDIAFELCFSTPREAEALAKQALAMANKLAYSTGIFGSYNILGVVGTLRGDHDKALAYYFKALEHSNKVSDEKRMGAVYHNIGLAYFRKGDYTGALEYYSRAVKIRKKYGHKTELAKDYNDIGSVYRELGDLTMALDYHFRALRLHKQVADRHSIAIANECIGVCYNEQGEYATALKYLLKSVRSFDKLGHKFNLTTSLMNLGIAYMHQRDYDKAEGLFFKCLQLGKETQSKLHIAYAYGLMGWAVKSLGKTEQSLEYYKKAYSLCEKIGSKSQSTEMLIHLAEALIEKGEFTEALEYCFKAMYLSSEIGNENSLMQAYLVTGILCKQSGRYNAALSYARQCMKMASRIGRKPDEMECCLLLTELYEAQHDFQNAFIHHKKYTELKESIFSAEKDKYINDLQAKYETEKKDKEKEIYRLKNVELRNEIKQRKKAERALKNHRDELETIVTERTSKLESEIVERKKVEQALLDNQKQLRSLSREVSLLEEKQRRKFATFLHDDISQALALATFKLRSVQETKRDKNAYKELDEIKKIIDKTAERTRTLAFEISPPILYELGLEPALEWLVRQFAEHYCIKGQFKDDGLHKPLPDESSVFLFQSVRELLANVAKHAHAHSVTVSVSRDGSSVRVGVEDDGIGFDLKMMNKKIKKSEGFGLFNVRERLRYLRGHMEIQAKKGKGSTVTLIAPLRRTVRKRTK